MALLTPVHIVTGFLGAGKTSLIKALLKQTGASNKRFIVNDFAPTGFDREVLGLVPFAGARSGCICCRGLEGILDELDQLAEQSNHSPAVDEIFLETSGLADLLELVDRLIHDRRFNESYQLRSIFTLVDGAGNLDDLKNVLEWRSQLAMADYCLITHLDSLAPELSAEAAKHAQEIITRYAPQSSVIPMPEAGDVLALMRGVTGDSKRYRDRLMQRPIGAETHGHAELKISEIPIPGVPEFSDVMGLVKAIVCVNPRLLRLKMRVCSGENPDGWVLIHVVGGRLQSPEWLEAKSAISMSGVMQVIDTALGENELKPIVDLFMPRLSAKIAGAIAF